MLVWLAIIRPLTRWAEGRYGDFLDKATWMLAGPQGMKLASFRSRILWRLLCTYRRVSGQNKSGLQNANPRRIPESTDAASFYLCGVNLSLDDVEDGDVAVARLPLSPRGHHHVLGLQKPPHHIQHGGFSHAGNLQSRDASGPVSTLNVSSV